MKESIRGLIIEAHPDDSALGEGIIESLRSKQIPLTCLTLTDGGARNLPHFSREQLIEQRYQESLEANAVSGITDVIHAKLPDGLLLEKLESGLEVVTKVVEQKSPKFILVTNLRDEHLDHAAAGFIAREVAGNEIPVYELDTQLMQDYNGNDLEYTHVIPISQRAVRRRNAAYRKHTSQTTNLPIDQMRDVNEVFALPRRRGQQFGVKFAAVLYQANPQAGDIIREIFNSDEKVLMKR